jgi:hypothetical protein
LILRHRETERQTISIAMAGQGIAMAGQGIAMVVSDLGWATEYVSPGLLYGFV